MNVKTKVYSLLGNITIWFYHHVVWKILEVMVFSHLQGISVMWKVLNYSNPGCRWAHKAKVRISLEHQVSIETASSQVNGYVAPSGPSSVLLTSCAVTWKVWCPQVAPEKVAAPIVERSGSASWRIGVKFFLGTCVNTPIKVYLTVISAVFQV